MQINNQKEGYELLELKKLEIIEAFKECILSSHKFVEKEL